jgi:hypothetical protein
MARRSRPLHTKLGHYRPHDPLLRLPFAADNAAMQTEPPKADSENRKRRWFQFSLRTLMIFTVVRAIGSAWVARKMERKRKEREAVNAITKLGGEAYWDYQRIPAKVGRGWRPEGAEPKGPVWLRKLLGENFFSEVECVYAVGGLENLKELPHLRELRLMSGGIADADLVNLKGLAELTSLGLIDTRVTDAAVKDLRKALPNCDVFVVHQNIPGEPRPADRSPDAK